MIQHDIPARAAPVTNDRAWRTHTSRAHDACDGSLRRWSGSPNRALLLPFPPLPRWRCFLQPPATNFFLPFASPEPQPTMNMPRHARDEREARASGRCSNRPPRRRCPDGGDRRGGLGGVRAPPRRIAEPQAYRSSLRQAGFVQSAVLGNLSIHQRQEAAVPPIPPAEASARRGRGVHPSCTAWRDSH